jgi:putative acetyltransferase
MLGETDQEFRIRAEQDRDHDAIAVVVATAFKSTDEADLVAAIRASPEYIPELSLVAELDGDVVGHVTVSWTGLQDGEVMHMIRHLSPLAVAPAYQGRGVGTALVTTVTAAARERGAPFVVLEGDPRYYSRFGFESSVLYGITMNLPTWAPPEAAQILLLNGEAPSVRGHVVHPPAFAAFVDY